MFGPDLYKKEYKPIIKENIRGEKHPERGVFVKFVGGWTVFTKFAEGVTFSFHFHERLYEHLYELDEHF